MVGICLYKKKKIGKIIAFSHLESHIAKENIIFHLLYILCWLPRTRSKIVTYLVV